MWHPSIFSFTMVHASNIVHPAFTNHVPRMRIYVSSVTAYMPPSTCSLSLRLIVNLGVSSSGLGNGSVAACGLAALLLTAGRSLYDLVALLFPLGEPGPPRFVSMIART